MNSKVKKYLHKGPFHLECGGVLPALEIAYHTYGKLNERKDNVVWVCHALTANSEVADWWPHTVEKGGFMDPEKWFIVCANIIGSCYGSTGPLSINPDTGKPYYNEFPPLTIGDLAKAHSILADYLGLTQINTLVGSSVGGFQAIEWICQQPSRFRKIILIATDIKASPWTIAINETQRMAITSDRSFGEHTPDAGMKGLAAARAIGLLSYRGPRGYNLSQQNFPETPPHTHRACTYQRHQGEKLCKRFNAYSYMCILDTFDTHDIGRNGMDAHNLLSGINIPTIVIGISSDIVFPPEDMRKLASMMPQAIYREIDSDFGHDGFLIEHKQLNAILNDFISK